MIPYGSLSQWEFQDPKMEVLYHIRPYFGGIFPSLMIPYWGITITDVTGHLQQPSPDPSTTPVRSPDPKSPRTQDSAHLSQRRAKEPRSHGQWDTVGQWDWELLMLLMCLSGNMKYYVYKYIIYIYIYIYMSGKDSVEWILDKISRRGIGWRIEFTENKYGEMTKKLDFEKPERAWHGWTNHSGGSLGTFLCGLNLILGPPWIRIWRG